MDWLQQRDPEESLEILRGLARICKNLGGSETARVHTLVEQSRFKDLVEYRLSYDAVDDVNDALYARQILSLFQKNASLDLGVDRASVAFRSFLAAEEKCRETNSFFKRLPSEPSLMDSEQHAISYRAVQKMVRVLGSCPSPDSLDFSFGPGANTNVKGAYASPRVKLSAPLVCSTNMVPVVGEYLSEVPPWVDLHASLETEESWVVNVTTQAGKLMFVPKNAKTDRSIVVEPLLNSFFQKGVGSYIRQRLGRFGIDLRDQSRNQRLANRGSVSGALCTVDLSSASDSISREVVKHLLPPDWFDLLDHLRTGEVTYPDGTTVVQQKFSSMGNAFTFELESAIFYCLTIAVCEQLQLDTEDVSVYGDDIICPTDAYPLLQRTLELYGFTVNLEKSFHTGFFRESCGADYLHGFDIRPCYVKTLIADRDLYSMHNWFLRHGERELAAYCLSVTHPDLRLFGPDGYGDGHLIGSYRLRLSRALRRSGWSGGFFDTYVELGRSYKAPLPGDSVLPAYSIYMRSGRDGPTDPYIVRGTRGYSKISIYTHTSRIFS